LADRLAKISLAELTERLWAWSLAGRSGQQVAKKPRELHEGPGVLEGVRVASARQADKRLRHVA
jgi:hypothetical protein